MSVVRFLATRHWNLIDVVGIGVASKFAPHHLVTFFIIMAVTIALSLWAERAAGV